MPPRRLQPRRGAMSKWCGAGSEVIVQCPLGRQAAAARPRRNGHSRQRLFGGATWSAVSQSTMRSRAGTARSSVATAIRRAASTPSRALAAVAPARDLEVLASRLRRRPPISIAILQRVGRARDLMPTPPARRTLERVHRLHLFHGDLAGRHLRRLQHRPVVGGRVRPACAACVPAVRPGLRWCSPLVLPDALPRSAGAAFADGGRRLSKAAGQAQPPEAAARRVVRLGTRPSSIRRGTQTQVRSRACSAGRLG